MIEYRMMREGAVLTSCLHTGPISPADLAQAGESPSWLETQAGLPVGTVARMLNALCRQYGSCGVMALDGDAIIGKVRFSPHGLGDGVPECVQQFPEAIEAFDPGLLPPREALDPKALVMWCVQLVADDKYRRRGIATAMVEQMANWAREEGWDEVHALAVRPVPPLLDLAGLLGLDTHTRLGFAAVGDEVNPDLLEVVQHMRAGGHGEAVRKQWEAFEHLSDEEAATVYDVVLPL